MINGDVEQFLDTGWFSEATLFLNGFVYWFEAQYDPNTDINTFFVDRWAAENEDNLYYHSLHEPDGTLVWERVIELKDPDLERIKGWFLEAPIFEGKTFWEVEQEVAWLDEGTPWRKGEYSNPGCVSFSIVYSFFDDSHETELAMYVGDNNVLAYERNGKELLVREYGQYNN